MATNQKRVGTVATATATAAAVLVAVALGAGGCGGSGSTGSLGSGSGQQADNDLSYTTSDTTSSTTPHQSRSSKPSQGRRSTPNQAHTSTSNRGRSSTSPPAARRIPSVVHAAGIVSFRMISGQASWESGSRNRAAHVQVNFYNGGSCRFTTVDTVGVPLSCTYSVDGDQISFSGGSTTAGAAGSSSLQVEGSVDLASHTMQLDYIGTSGMAAVVNGQSFAQSNGIHWDAEMKASF